VLSLRSGGDSLGLATQAAFTTTGRMLLGAGSEIDAVIGTRLAVHTSGASTPASSGVGVLIAGTLPLLDFYETTGGANAKFWRLVVGGNILSFQTVNDAYTAAVSRMTLDAAANLSIGGSFNCGAVGAGYY
jgi:hypothetical protein